MHTNQDLIDRLNDYIRATGAPMSAFARRVDLSAASIYQWKRGELKLSDASLKRIDTHLKRFGF